MSDFAGLPYAQQNITPGLPSYRIVAVSAGTIYEAARRYLTDPILRYRVNAAVATMEREHGIRFDDHDRAGPEGKGSSKMYCQWRERRRGHRKMPLTLMPHPENDRR